jgi:pSer/pThr/pTyr-binding forkhead associated (FHA) protein
MSLLLIKRAGEDERVFRIRSQHIVIGRDERCELVLPSAAVSRRHACLSCQGDQVELQDLGSKNGVKVNGETVAQRVLEHGDRVRVAGYRLEFVDERRMDMLLVTRLSRLNNKPAHSLRATMSTLFMADEVTNPLDEAWLTAALKRCDGSGHWKPGSGRLTIGPGGDVPVEIALTSQPVAEILWDGEQHVLRAWSWAHRVEVDGQQVREAVLRPGVTVQVAEACFEFVHELS